MSFWSSLEFVRAAPPPVVTAAALGGFVQDLVTTGALTDEGSVACRIRYGSPIDADQRTTDVIEWDESGLIGTVGEYPWDVFETFPSRATLTEALAADVRCVYRADLSLGKLHPDVVAALTREPSEENRVGLCLSELSFQVGPVLVAGLGSEAAAFAGWMALSFSGPGYFFPWEYREVRERAEALRLFGRLSEACRRTWPIPPVSPSAEAVAGRRQLAELWLYDDFALPPDWLWFVTESG